MTYDPQFILNAVDVHRTEFLVTGGVALIFNYLYFFGAAMAARRGDVKGQSVLTWVSYCDMLSCWFLSAYLFFGPTFHTPLYLLMAATSIAGGIVLTLLTYKMNHHIADMGKTVTNFS